MAASEHQLCSMLGMMTISSGQPSGNVAEADDATNSNDAVLANTDSHSLVDDSSLPSSNDGPVEHLNFFALPPEIRNKIYHYMSLQTPRRYKKAIETIPQPSSLLLVNRQFHQEIKDFHTASPVVVHIHSPYMVDDYEHAPFAAGEHPISTPYHIPQIRALIRQADKILVMARCEFGEDLANLRTFLTWHAASRSRKPNTVVLLCLYYKRDEEGSSAGGGGTLPGLRPWFVLGRHPHNLPDFPSFLATFPAVHLWFPADPSGLFGNATLKGTLQDLEGRIIVDPAQVEDWEWE